MSEQLSPSTGGGLLSLNLSITPQGAQPGLSGTVPLLGGGFGAVLNQQTDASAPAVEFASGGMLPPEGEALPQKLEPLLPEEQMQDQLRQIAQLLEQQSAQDTQLPPELSAELARALRQYTEQQPIMPVKGGNGKELGAIPSEATQDKVVSVPANPGMGALDGKGQDQGQGQVVVSPPPKVAPLDVDPNAKAELAQLKAEVLQANVNSGQENSAEASKVQAQSSVAVNDAPMVSASQNSAQVTAQDSTQNSNGKNSADNLASAPLSNAQVQNAQNAQQPQVAANAATDVPKSQQLGAGGAAVKAEGALTNAKADLNSAPAKSEKAVSAADVAETKPFDPIAKKVDLDVTRSANRSVAEPTVPLQSAKSDFVLNPQADNSRVRKIESALDMTQQLMQKVAASDKGDVTATQVVERLASNTVGQVNSASPTTAQKVVTEGQNLMMPQNVKVNTPAWNNALGERAIMIAAQNTRVAEIKLDPPELGSLNIRVNINQDQVSLNFTSPHAHVRDAVEQSLPRLREMFAEQGLALQDSSVSDQSSEQQRREQFAEGDGAGGQYGGGANVDGEEGVQPESAKSVSLVDYYA